MIIVRETFIAKPGMASKLARLFRDTQSNFSGVEVKPKIMTDFTGQLNKVVIETELKSLADFEARMKEYASNAKARKSMSGYLEMYLTGEREIFQVLE